MSPLTSRNDSMWAASSALPDRRTDTHLSRMLVLSLDREMGRVPRYGEPRRDHPPDFNLKSAFTCVPGGCLRFKSHLSPKRPCYTSAYGDDANNQIPWGVMQLPRSGQVAIELTLLRMMLRPRIPCISICVSY